MLERLIQFALTQRILMLLLVALYILYLTVYARLRPEAAPPASGERASMGEALMGLLPPLALIVVVLGLVALTRLQIDLLPSIELPTLTVRTQFEGADPEVMERLVTQIVEEIVATVPGVEEITSTSGSVRRASSSGSVTSASTRSGVAPG